MTGEAETLIILLVLLNVPMLLQVPRSFSPLSIDSGASRFTGRYSGWEVGTFTGKVAATNTSARTARTGDDTVPARRETAGTDVCQAILLVDAARRRGIFTLRNFGIPIFRGQVISVCWAVRGRKSVTFAALNHSTRQQAIEQGSLNRIAMPRHGLTIFWLFVSCLTIVGIPVAIVFGALNARQRGRFGRSGIRPLWSGTQPRAAAAIAVAIA